jgi:hypothetical protein
MCVNLFEWTKTVKIFVFPAYAYQRVTSSEEDFINLVNRMNCSVNKNWPSFSDNLAITQCTLMNKMAMVAMMEVIHRLSNVDYHLPRPGYSYHWVSNSLAAETSTEPWNGTISWGGSRLIILDHFHNRKDIIGIDNYSIDLPSQCICFCQNYHPWRDRMPIHCHDVPYSIPLDQKTHFKSKTVLFCFYTRLFYHYFYLEIKHDLRTWAWVPNCQKEVLWWLILGANLIGLRDTQVLLRHSFYVCLWINGLNKEDSSLLNVGRYHQNCWKPG